MKTFRITGYMELSPPRDLGYQHSLCIYFLAFITGMILFLSSCTQNQSSKDDTTKPALAKLGKWGVETQYIDKNIRPGDDFYRYVNKGWLDTAKIPTGLPGIEAFTGVALHTEDQVKTIIEDLKTEKAEPGTPAQQISDLHASFINIERRNALGMSMLKDDLAGILKAEDHEEISQLMGRIGYPALFDAGVVTDPGNPARYIFLIHQGGLGLPGRDFYLKSDEPFVSLRAHYAEYIEGVLNRAGVDAAKQKASDILAFEKAVAEHQWTPEQDRDAVSNYHVMSREELAAYAPGFVWRAYFKEIGFERPDKLQVSNDTAIKAMAALFASTPAETLRSYMAYHYLDSHASLLSEEWVDAKFDMFSRKLAGIAEQRPLDVRAVQFLNERLGEEVGKLYVERFFPAESKAEMEKLVSFLRQAFHDRLTNNDWMDDATREEALAKLDSFTVKIGYPDKWHDYSSVTISADDLVGNVYQLVRWHQNDDMARLDEPVRTWEWVTTPQTVNAFYLPTGNQVIFPAAVLQPPFFDPNADPAVNFGAIGMVIGHELGHGFDDQGSRYDGTGALRNWWRESSRENFEEKAKRLVAQYNQYSPVEGLNVNGQLTLGENIGDMGGIAIAYTAYQKYSAVEYGGKPPVLDGFTGNQRFFLGYAQLWRNIMTDDFLRQLVLTNAHSPGEFRVNGIVRNFDPWYEAFGANKESKLYLPEDERVSIW
jgi:putative endopeptidase